MADTGGSTVLCGICARRFSIGEAIAGSLVSEPVAGSIQKAHPGWSRQGYICREDLNRFRAKYVQDALELEKGELWSLEQEAVRGRRDYDFLSKNINMEFDKQLTPGERVADTVASFGGSWTFIISFAVVLVVWILINSWALLRPQPFDPYPYILLNLALSCLSSLQGPIILMSQNRQDAKDRMRSEYDYRVNLKAELEIRHLNAKMDLLLTHQWRRLMEVQEIQMELMQEQQRGKSAA